MPIKTTGKVDNSRDLVNRQSLRALYSGLLFTAFASMAQPAGAHGIGWDLSAPYCLVESCALTESGPRYPLWQMSAQLAAAPLEGGLQDWRLVRTPGPEKNEVVSIMRTADIMRSDAEFAGIMIRCRENSVLQVGFMVITPFHPRSHPKIIISINNSEIQFQAEVIAPGSLVALPNEAQVLARGAWKAAKELKVDIEGEGAKIHGIVSLENLSGAIAQLQASCPQ